MNISVYKKNQGKNDGRSYAERKKRNEERMNFYIKNETMKEYKKKSNERKAIFKTRMKDQ